MQRADEFPGGLERRIELGGIGERPGVDGDQRVEIWTTLVIGSNAVEVGLRHFARGRLARNICIMELGDGGFFDGKRRSLHGVS